MKKPIGPLLLLVSLAQFAIGQELPVAHGHAHNDYQHTRPLYEALESGFTSIEADVYLTDNELRVSHMPFHLNKKKTLEQLYLDPLKAVIARNGGHVYRDSTPVILMIDFKTGGDETYAQLKEVLAGYKDLLTLYKNDSVIRKGALQILISGSKPFKAMAKDDTLMATVDGDIKRMNDTMYARLITRYSDPWGSYFSWNGKNEMPNEQLALLDSLVKAVHGKGKDIRFYHIPDVPLVWKTLLAHGVDWINSDKLLAYKRFYLEEHKH